MMHGQEQLVYVLKYGFCTVRCTAKNGKNGTKTAVQKMAKKVRFGFYRTEKFKKRRTL